MKKAYLYVSKKRREAIANEVFDLTTRYSLDRFLSLKISRLYLSSETLKLGSITKNMAYIDAVLENYGFTPEEKERFIYSNSNLLFADYSDLVRKLVILNHFGLFEDTFFGNFSVLDYNYVLKGLGFRELYAILSDREISNVGDITHIFGLLTPNEVNYLTKKYPLTSELYMDFSKEFNKFMFMKKVESRAILKRKLTTIECENNGE